jgi:hypothetical protein
MHWARAEGTAIWKLQIPNTKYQINSNVPNSNIKAIIVLVIENWDLRFVWNLEFGVPNDEASSLNDPVES